SAHLQQHINAGASGLGEDLLHRVFGRRIENHVGAHSLGHGPPLLIGFRGEHRRAAAGLGYNDRHQANRPASRYECGLTCNWTGQYGVYSVPQRIQDRTVALWNAGIQLDDVGSGNLHTLREGPILIDADDSQVLADMRFTETALMAVAAIYMHLGA